MTGGHWQHRILGITACGADPAPAGTAPAAAAQVATDPERIGCLRCAVAVKAVLRRVREQNRLTAGPDNALLLRQGLLPPSMLWKHRFGPEPPETPEVLAAYRQANLRADEALDTALYVMGMETKAAQEYARRAYAEYLQDYANDPEHF